MFRNYCLTAWKVFLRRKFFTFINLFGIILTLMVLLVAAALFDGVVNPTGPEVNSNNYLVIDRLSVSSKDGNNNWSSRMGYKFIQSHVQPLEAPEIISIYMGEAPAVAFKDGGKISPDVRRTDANYWRILNFNFLEGRAFNQDELDSGSFLAVISENFRDTYFNEESVVGKQFVISNQRFSVVGVVENVSILEREAYADIWVPYTTSPSTSYRETFLGSWSAMLYSSSTNGLNEMRDEYRNIVEHNFKSDDPERFATAISAANTKLEQISRTLTSSHDEFESGMSTFYAMAAGAILLFMLLPSINMININISRILERSTEIGLRKAFGASSNHLVTQFLVENILLTFIGGILGFIGAFIVLDLISTQSAIAYADFSINLNLLVWGVVMIFLFGVISGIYPAWKMSRLHPINALKGEA